MSVAEKMTAIADAIREKTGDTGKLSLDGMAESLRKLPGPIVATAVGNPIALSDATDLKLRGLKLFGKTTQNGTPTPDAPVPLVSAGDGGSVGVTVAGKNLLNPNYVKIDNVKNQYYTVLYTTDNFSFTFKAGVKYTFSFDTPNTGIKVYFNGQFFGADKTVTLDGSRQYNTFSFAVDTTITGKKNIVSRGTVTSDIGTGLISNIQLEVGSTATEYEPYKQSQTLNLSTPNGLPGIPVTSGGNYTDETGQQWVCDEVDFGRGVYVQRLSRLDNIEFHILSGFRVGDSEIFQYIVPDGSLSREEILSNKFRYDKKALYSELTAGYQYSGNLYVRIAGVSDEITFNSFAADAVFYYVLQNPNEIALSAEELSAYAALHTNYPNTTILNDGGAGMEVSYVADTKLYIDNKINAMAAAIVNA